jgi:hypothetical protein
MQTLVIYDEPELIQVLGTFAKHVLGGEVIFAKNLAEAAVALRNYRVGTFSLIISRCNVTANDTAPADLDRIEATAVQFLRDMYPDEMLPACIFVAAQPTERYLDALAGMKRARLIPVMDVPVKIVEIIQELVNGKKVSRHEHFFDIEIALNGTGTGSYWRLRGKEGSGVERNGPIIIPPDELDTLLFHSELVGATKLEAELVATELIRRLGRDICRCIVEDRAHSPGLGDELCSRTSNWDRIDATRLRFEVDDKTSQLLVETLARPRRHDEKSEQDLWISRSPIFRRFGSSCGRMPLYKDRASREKGIHCLVIQGCSETFFAECGGAVKKYGEIKNATGEVNWLADYFDKDYAAFGMDTFKVVHASDYPDGGFGQCVRELLADGPWQLIHYTGHSDLGGDGEGYLVMGPHDGDVISIEEFAHAASKVQFVFLNSCLSANPGFIRRLVERDVPAAAGYAWPVPDIVAKTFCEAFYSDLFQSKADRGFIEYAYMRAKASLRDAYPSHAMWTAPLLYMQTMDGQASN